MYINLYTSRPTLSKYVCINVKTVVNVITILEHFMFLS